jgi:hypothetical protein
MAKGRQTQELDDGIRGLTGVVVSVAERPDGQARLVFDDVARADAASPYQWNSEWFFTRAEFALADLLEGRLDEKDYVNIGHAIVSRLVAQYEARGAKG